VRVAAIAAPVAAAFLSLGGAITRQGTFYLYAGLTVLAVVFFARRVPEKDRSLEQIQHEPTDEPVAATAADSRRS
jgi:hypothetical protein